MPIDNFDAFTRNIMDVELLRKCNEVILNRRSTWICGCYEDVKIAFLY